MLEIEIKSEDCVTHQSELSLETSKCPPPRNDGIMHYAITLPLTKILLT